MRAKFIKFIFIWRLWYIGIIVIFFKNLWYTAWMITEAAVLESRFMNGAAVLDMIEGTYGKATFETKIYSSPWVSNPSITSCTGFIKGFGVHRPDSGSQVGL